MDDFWDSFFESWEAAGTVAGYLLLFWLAFQILKGLIYLAVYLVYAALWLISSPVHHPKVGVPFLIAGALVALAYFGVVVPVKASQEAEIRELQAGYSAAETARHAANTKQAELGLQILQKAGVTGGSIPTEVRIVKPEASGEYAQLSRLEHGAEGWRLYFQSASSQGKWYNLPRASCLFWGKPPTNWRDPIQPLSSNYTEKLPDDWDPHRVASGATIFTYDGYIVYPGSLIPSDLQAIANDPVLYFNYGCAVTNPWVPILDLRVVGGGQPIPTRVSPTVEITPTKIESDLIGQEIPFGTAGDVWQFGSLAVFRNVAIAGREPHADLTTYHVTMDLVDTRTNKSYTATADLDYDGAGHLITVKGQAQEAGR